MVKLSVTSKLGCKSWSLQAIETCPGSVGTDGELVDSCKSCYATQGCYNFPDTKNLRSYNKEDWKREEWVDDMVHALRNQSYFRWLDSGDVYSLELADKIYQVMARTPHCAHWLPTRMMKFAKFQPVLESMQSLPNVMVRFSSDSVMGEYGPNHGSTISESGTADGAFPCNAYNQGGKCLSCRACWNKDIPVVCYKAHGRKIAKVITLRKAA